MNYVKAILNENKLIKDTKANITVPKLNTPKLSKEENEKYESVIKKLADLGIHIRVYNSLSQNIQHPDGEHTYRKDATEAQRLLEDNKELPQDILDRLAYYKTIMDKQLEFDKADEK